MCPGGRRDGSNRQMRSIPTSLNAAGMQALFGVHHCGESLRLELPACAEVGNLNTVPDNGLLRRFHLFIPAAMAEDVKRAGEKLKVFISYSRRDMRHSAWNPL
jgi:hypothetical protein